MKTAMKLTLGTLAIALMTSAGWGQNTDAIDNARSVAKSLQQKQANDTNAALNAAGVRATAKPAPGAPAPAVKPAVIPSSKPASAAAQSAAVKPAAQPAKSSTASAKSSTASAPKPKASAKPVVVTAKPAVAVKPAAKQ